MEIKLLLREKDRQIIAKNFRTGTLLANGGAPRGQSAYEQAVEGGYTGTKANFEQALATDFGPIADNIEDIATVSDNISSVETVSQNISGIETVLQNITDIATVADNATAVSTAATNMAAIIAAPTEASNAAGSASAASTSANNASNSATNAQKWAEGTDAQVTPLGGEHSAKGWANVAKGYADSIDFTNYRTSVAQDAIDITKQPKTLSAPITVNGQSQTTVEGALNAINENSSIANTSLSNLTSSGENHFVRLQSGVSQADVDYVVESYVNGTSWYRVYKSGWCEQGGYSSSAVTTVNLLKSFTDTNYTITATNISSSPSGSFAVNIQKSTTSFTTEGTQPFGWQASGYIS